MPVDRISRLFGSFAGWGYVIVFGLTVFEVVSRFVFGAPTTWVLEICILVGGLGYLFAGPLTHQERGHIRIETLYVRCGERVRRYLDLLADVLTLVYACALVYAALLIALPAIRRGERTGSAFNSPEPVILKTAIAVAAALFALQGLRNLVARWRQRP